MVRVEWTASNLLSLSRVLLLIPILYLLLNPSSENRLVAAALMVVASATDFLDGVVARKYDQESEFGRVLDPLSDKICAGAVVIVLSALRAVPIWFVLAVIGRDVLILLGGLYIARTKKVVLHSSWAGKITMGVVALFLIIATLQVEAVNALQSILLWGSTAFLAFSLFTYSKRFYETILAKAELAR